MNRREAVNDFMNWLGRYDFSPMTGAPLLLTRECANRKDYVEIDAPKFTDGIGVTLQSVNKDGQRREMLESFRGVARYGLDGLDSGSYLETLAAMREDFEKYAIPWYSGIGVQTQGLILMRHQWPGCLLSVVIMIPRSGFSKKLLQ